MILVLEFQLDISKHSGDKVQHFLPDNFSGHTWNFIGDNCNRW